MFGAALRLEEAITCWQNSLQYYYRMTETLTKEVILKNSEKKKYRFKNLEKWDA